MDAARAQRNIRLYQLYMTFKEPLFWGPVVILSIQRLAHMTLPEIYVMESMALLLILILEIPSGALADLIGRKRTVAVGSVFGVLSIVAFTTMNSPLDAWVANGIWAIGFSLWSGADSAFLYDSLKEAGREKEYKRIEGGAIGNKLLLFAVGSLATGFLAEIDLRLPLLLSLPGVVISTVAAFCFAEPPRTTRHYTPSAQLRVMANGIRIALRTPVVRWAILFAALLTASSKVWFFTYNPYFELVDLDIRYYGAVFFVLNIVAWLFSRYAYALDGRVPEKAIVVGMVFVIGMPILVMGLWVTTAAVSMVLFQNVVRGLQDPFFKEFLNRHISSHNRATVLSVKSCASGIAQFAGLAVFGVMLGVWSLPTCLQVLGVFVLVAGAASLYDYVHASR